MSDVKEFVEHSDHLDSVKVVVDSANSVIRALRKSKITFKEFMYSVPLFVAYACKEYGYNIDDVVENLRGSAKEMLSCLNSGRIVEEYSRGE
jgi:hypothetical protein